MSQFKVLLCGESPLYSQSLAVAFGENHLFRVTENIAFEDLIPCAVRIQPDVAILRFDDETALPLLLELRANCPMLLQVAIVDDPGRFDMFELINSGVRGCLPLRILPRQIVNAVELIVIAGLLCLPRLNPRDMNNGNREKNVENIDTLTSREREVLILLGKSFSNQEIAESLCLSESTVKTHLRNVFRKLRVRNRSEAMALLYGNNVMRSDKLA
ncbi:MAG TPA: response regulator transcription factor [Syntrophomonadaceae bacterium]|nr:response regulator transcription factor [Syntrophomonadaceae bacterium]